MAEEQTLIIVLFLLNLLFMFVSMLSALGLYGFVRFWRRYPANMPIVWNFNKKYSQFSQLLELPGIEERDGKIRVRCVPRDWRWTMLVKEPPIQVIVMTPERRVAFARGTVSPEREIVMYLPKYNVELQEVFKGTPFEDLFDKATYRSHLTNRMQKLSKNYSSDMATLLQAAGVEGTSLARAIVKLYEDYSKTLVDTLKTKEEETSKLKGTKK